jgi:hypothetical protein
MCAVTAILGLFISNTATAVLMAPVALAVAEELQASPYPFAMIVALAASVAFRTPVSSPVNTLVVGQLHLLYLRAGWCTLYANRAGRQRYAGALAPAFLICAPWPWTSTGEECSLVGGCCLKAGAQSSTALD